MTTRLLSLQLLLAFAVANARNDSPPTSDRAWSPPDLPNYERDLVEQHLSGDRERRAKSGLRTKRESRHAIRNLYDGQRSRTEHGRLGAASRASS